MLIRPRNNRVIAGVCAALANRFGWNVTTVRILFVVSIIIPGSQLLAYALLWILIPGEK